MQVILVFCKFSLGILLERNGAVQQFSASQMELISSLSKFPNSFREKFVLSD